MESFGLSFYPQDQFSSWTPYECRDEERFPYGDTIGLPSNEIMHRNSSSAMHRFMHDHDLRPLFTPCYVLEDPNLILPLPEVASELVKASGARGHGIYYSERTLSPTHSGMASSYVSSDLSDRRDSPISSPNMVDSPYTPVHDNIDGIPYLHGGHYDYGNPGKEPCVAMHDIQAHADDQTEKYDLDEESVMYVTYGNCAVQEGYQPLPCDASFVMESADSTPVDSHHMDMDCVIEPEQPRYEPQTPNTRRRRAPSKQSITSPVISSKVAKRSQTGKRSSSSGLKQKSSNQTSPANAANRAFPCPLAIYGCQSTFGSKNEWKRHVNTQHMRFEFWRCDQCPNAERKPNDFNRKDLFTQHVRRMHLEDGQSSDNKKKSAAELAADEQRVNAASQQCHKKVRVPPERSGCLFCPAEFHGSSTWDERLEHIGRHMETAKKDNEMTVDQDDWRIDGAVQTWMLEQGILLKAGKQLVLAESRA